MAHTICTVEWGKILSVPVRKDKQFWTFHIRYYDQDWQHLNNGSSFWFKLPDDRCFEREKAEAASSETSFWQWTFNKKETEHFLFYFTEVQTSYFASNGLVIPIALFLPTSGSEKGKKWFSVIYDSSMKTTWIEEFGMFEGPPENLSKSDWMKAKQAQNIIIYTVHIIDLY